MQIVYLCLSLSLILLTTGCGPALHNSNDDGNNANSFSNTLFWAESKAILSQNCASCHDGGRADGNVGNILNPDALVASGLIVPGDANSSQLIDSVVSGRMPESSPLANGDIQILIDWVNNMVDNSIPIGTTNPTPTPTPLPTPVGSLTEDEFYQAKIGPNGQSVDDLVTSRCIQCHTANPPATYIGAKDWLIIQTNDPAGNLFRLRNIVGPTGLKLDLTMKATGNNSLHDFAKGHKPKSPPYTTADLTFIKQFVDGF